MLETLTAPQNSYVSWFLLFASAVQDPGVPGEQAILVAQDGSYVSSVKCERPYIHLFTGEYFGKFPAMEKTTKSEKKE